MVRALVLFAVPVVVRVASWKPPSECVNEDWNDDSRCCCAFCDAAKHMEKHIEFAPILKSECLNLGGQCKSPQMSAYKNRRPRAPMAVAEVPQPGEPEQVHLIGGYPDEATVVYLTAKRQPSEVEFRLPGSHEVHKRRGTADTYSLQNFPQGDTHDNKKNFPATGHAYATCDGSHESQYNATCIYSSGIIHTVKLEELQPGSQYEYRPHGSSRWRRFKTPPAVGQPVSFGLVADLGQTTDALRTMQHMKHALDGGRIDTVIFPGDISYADGFAPAWDYYGRLSEFLWESLPAAYIVGNHEYGVGLEQNVNFLPRYGWPSKARSNSDSKLWYSFEVGLAHVVNLCSYCDSSPSSLQGEWLKADLESVDRKRTPWVVVSLHTPYYSANIGHQDEGEVIRNDVEDLFYEHKVDIVFAGHVHAYDRTKSVYKNQTTCDGPVYVTIGDGGNQEGPYCGWRHLEWSAFTENSFGYGEFSIMNSSHAQWRFYRNQDSEAVAADSVWLKPASQRCEAQIVV